jgi:hypothetical protein
MMERRYLVDNNALISIGTRRWKSAFFREHCRVTEDVAHEARYRARSLPADLVVPVTPAILRQVPLIMNSVVPGDTRLLDLYGNKGAADPVLVATAVVLQEEESDSLVGDTLVIVTRDDAVNDKSKDFGIETISPDELAALIDAAEGAIDVADDSAS